MQSCYICGEAETQEHHLIPIGYGGKKEGKTVWLCATHHEKVHKAAAILTSKTKNLAKLETLFSAEEKDKAFEIVRLIALSKITKDERIQRAKGETIQRLTIELTYETMQLLKKLKLDSGATNMSNYLTALIWKESRKL